MPAFDIPANLAFDNYTDLITAVEDWMNRGDLSGSVQAMIALAEARMRRKLESVFGEVTDSLTTTDGTAALPSDCRTLNRVVYNYYNVPRWSGFSTAALDSADYATSPFAYTVEAGQIRLWPPVDVTLTVFYQQTLTSLSEDSPTNEILSNHPDLYFFGAMMFAEGYVANDERAGLFKQLFDEGLDEVATFLRQQRYTGQLVPKIAREW